MQPILKYASTNFTILQKYSKPLCLLFFFIFFLNNISQGQINLKDTATVYALIDSTHTIKQTDRARAEELANKCITLADEIGEPMARARARLSLAVLNLNNFKPQSKQILWEAIAICEEANLPNQKASAYNNLGLNYRQEGKLDSALYCYKECLKYAEDNNITDLIWKSKLGLGRIYNGNNQEAAAEKELLETWDFIENEELKMAKGMTIYLLASHYFQTRNEEQFGKWQAIWQNHVVARYKSVEDIITPSHYSLSFFFEDFPRTIERFDTTLAYHIARKDTAKIAMTYWDLADTYRKEKKYKASLEAFAKAQPLMEQKMGQFFLVSFYKKQYETAKLANDIPIALTSYENLQNQLTKARKSEMDKQMAELEIKYETAEKEVQIAKANQEKNFMWFIFGLLGVLSGIIIWSLRNRLKIKGKLAVQSEELQRQRIQQLESEKQLTAYNSMLEGQEQERARIAKELHDGLGGLLATIKAYFTTFASEKNPPLYQKTNQLLDAACKEVRTISHNMMPHSLMLSGLESGIEDLATSLKAENIKCDFETIGWNDALCSPTQQVMVYRIIQELVQNIRKHAAAKQVLIQLMRHQKELTLIVEDDGKGFIPKQKSDGIGLKNIQSRIQFLKGMIDIDTVEGEGTTTTIRIPIHFQKNGKTQTQKTETPNL